MKSCRECGENKPLSEFHWDSRRADGRCYYCKTCKNRRTKDYANRCQSRSVVDTGTKLCPRCQKNKPVTDFGRRTTTPDGRCWCCKRCYNALAQQRRQQPEHAVAVARKRQPINTSVYHQRRKGDPAYRDRRAKRNSEARTRRRARRYNGKSIPYSDTQVSKKIAYWGGRCWMCGCIPPSGLHMDHVKPISKGGMDCLSNLRPACGTCNSRKNARWPYPPAGAAHRQETAT